MSATRISWSRDKSERRERDSRWRWLFSAHCAELAKQVPVQKVQNKNGQQQIKLVKILPHDDNNNNDNNNSSSSKRRERNNRATKITTTKGNQSCCCGSWQCGSVAAWHKLLNNLSGAERTFSLKFANVFKVRDNSQRDDYSSEFICLLGMQNATMLQRLYHRLSLPPLSRSLSLFFSVSFFLMCVCKWQQQCVKYTKIFRGLQFSKRFIVYPKG